MRRRLVATAIAAGLLVLPGAAEAATVTDATTGEPLFEAAPGEANNVTVRVENGRVVFADAGAALQAGGACTQDAASRVSCPSGEFPHASLMLRDQDDRLDAQLPDLGRERQSTNVYANGGAGRDVLSATAYMVSLTADDEGTGSTDAESLTAVVGTRAFLYGGGGPDRMDTSALNTDLVGGGGDDTIIGSPRIDAGYPSFDIAYGGPGDDRINTGTGNDILRGEDGNDRLDAGPDSDELDGGNGRDDLEGGTGRDTLRGGEGDDTLDGGGGDTFHWDDPPTFPATRDGQFPDKLDGGPGSDTLNGGDGDFDTVTYDGRQAPVLISLDGLRNDGERGERDLIGTDVEELVGGEGDDTVRGSANGNFLAGGAGDDLIDAGGGFHDVAHGNKGNDTIITLDGGAEGRLGAPGAMNPTYFWDDGVLCDDSPSAPYADTAIVDPADGGVNSQLAAGGCETILMTETPQSMPVDDGSVQVPVTCGASPIAGATCTGTAVVEQYLPAKSGQASKKRVVGKRTFKAKVWRKAKLRVKLNSTGRKAARGKRRLSAVRVAYRLKPKRR